MKTVVANTKFEKEKGLTGAPKNSVGIFNYMNPQQRIFHRTDRDLSVYADGDFVGNLTKDNPKLIVPAAERITEEPYQQGRSVQFLNKGGKVSLYRMLCQKL